MENNNYSIIEAAIIAGIWAVLIMVVLFTPLLLVSMFILPLPIAVMVMRRGLRIAIIFTITALVLAVIMSLFLPATILIIYSIIVGLISGYAIQKRLDPVTCYGMVVLAVLASQIVAFAILVSVTNNTLFAQLIVIMEESLVSSEQLLLGWGLVQSTELDVVAAVSLLKLMLPTLVITSSIAIGYGYFYVLRYFTNKYNATYNLERLPSIANFRLPQKILWYYLGGLLAYLMFIVYEHEKGLVYTLTFNYLQIISFALAIQGLGLLWYYMKKKQWSLWLRVPLLLLVVHPLLMQIMTWVGMFDSIFNWRKIPESFNDDKLNKL